MPRKNRFIQIIAASPPVRAAAVIYNGLDRLVVKVVGLLVMPFRALYGRLLRDRGRLAARLAPLSKAAGAVKRHVFFPFGRFLTRLPWSVIFFLFCFSCGLVAAALWRWHGSILPFYLGITEAQKGALTSPLLLAVWKSLPLLAGVFSVLAFIASLQAFVRIRWSLWVIKASAAGYITLLLMALVLAWGVPSALYSINSELFPTSARNECWVRATFWLVPFFLHAAGFVFLLLFRSASGFYGRSPAAPGKGERLWRNLRTHGEDPRFRKSLYWAAGLQLFFLIVLPLLVLRGCVDPYDVPGGAGATVLQVVKIKEKKKPEKKYVLNMNTPISFYIPKIDESEIFQEVEQLTQDQYEAQKLGQQKKGAKVGDWPHGMEGAKVRFLRLQYDGGDWDQDMGYGADYNMLLMFKKLTGFDIWHETESVAIRQLPRYPKNRAPPFVYMTGGLKGSISLSQADVRALRHYCLEMGGMIFADNGGGNFDRSFRQVLRRTFPELPLVEIPFDDVIFRRPFYFPHGAPPLWHHSGNTALGVKYRGRWIVFYHQGDINDAWKDGHSGASEGVAMQAYKLGVNVINYAFTQYMQMHYGEATGE